jgi:peptide subunit release factor RF-3
VQFEPLPYRIARWIGSEYDLNRLERPGHALCVIDIEDRPLVLFDNEWSLRAAERTHENLHLLSAVQPGRRARG